MRPSTKAALLSGLVFPGIGQMYLKRLGRGIAILVCVLAGIGTIVWVAAAKALAILEQIERQSGRIDMETVSQLALTSSVEVSPYYDLVLVFVVCCWLFSIVDAYRVGRRIERSEKRRGV